MLLKPAWMSSYAAVRERLCRPNSLGPAGTAGRAAVAFSANRLALHVICGILALALPVQRGTGAAGSCVRPAPPVGSSVPPMLQMRIMPLPLRGTAASTSATKSGLASVPGTPKKVKPMRRATLAGLQPGGVIDGSTHGWLQTPPAAQLNTHHMLSKLRRTLDRLVKLAIHGARQTAAVKLVVGPDVDNRGAALAGGSLSRVQARERDAALLQRLADQLPGLHDGRAER